MPIVDFLIDSIPYVLGLLVLANFIKSKLRVTPPEKYKPEEKPIPKLENQDMNLSQLRKYNGIDKENIVVAVNKKLYDVSKRSDIYGPGGAYHIFAGKDASRALATMNMDPGAMPDFEFDDLEDLTPVSRNQLADWEGTYEASYGPAIGNLIR